MEKVEVGAGPDDAGVAALVARRRRVRLWWGREGRWADAADPLPPVGLALSGGGIRSATFALGLLQGLAKSPRDALARVDVLSSVSGGGYAGCFFRSLFVPEGLRDVAATAPSDGVLDAQIADQYRLARAALGSGPDVRRLSWRPRGQAPKELRNPLWWLREHSRYLAPTGATDYGFAVAYLARNWLAMVYLFVLACTAIAAPIVMLEAAAIGALGWPALAPAWLSPLAPLPVVFVAAAAVFSIAYWATQGMSTNEPVPGRQRRSLALTVLWILAGVALAAVLVGWVVARGGPGGSADAALGPVLAWIYRAGASAMLAAVALAVVAALALWGRQFMLTAELRLWLTRRLAEANRLALAFAVLAVVDSLGAWAAAAAAVPGSMPGLGTAALFPALAFLIKKVPDWVGGTGTGVIGGLLKRFASAVAFVVGLLLYGLLAVGAAAMVHGFAWTGDPWQSAPHWPRLLVLTGLAWILALLSGRATGFINLSSLHAFYSARLIRAYLGASNVGRLCLAEESDHPRPITENHAGDYIQPQVYGETDLPAPIHLINVTLNETIDPASQIVARDRKGDILTLEPGGIRIGQKLIEWGRLTNSPPVDGQNHAEGISLGQWCAISGAAASSAMGRMTNLGFALAFTFANIRLGYWWWAPDVCADMPAVTGPKAWFARQFGTFVYLANEMTCRYSRGYARKYLTDGGHYENSGAYPLIRRGVPLVIVSDCGADPAFQFDDLQTLVRQVRVDLGAETTILGGTDLTVFLATLGTTDAGVFVDPERWPDWQARMLDPRTPAFVLALRVALDGADRHLLWVKPRLLPDVPTDLAGYAALTKSFPQQPTGDQFFDEAQWESYRRLGEESVARLLEACPKLLAAPAVEPGGAGPGASA